MSWSFVLGTTDKVNKRKDNVLFLFCTGAGQDH